MRNTERLELLRHRMRKDSIEALVLTEPHFVAAIFDGAQLFNGNRVEPPGRVAIVITSRQIIVLGNYTEAERIASDELQEYPLVECVKIPWHLWDLRKATDTLINERSLTSWWADSFGEHRRKCRELLESLLYPLTKVEVDRLRSLGNSIARTFEDCLGWIESGVTEIALCGEVHRALLAKGILPDLIFVAFDERIEKYRHCKPSDNKFNRTAMISITASYLGLYASATRMLTLANPSEQLIEDTLNANSIEVAAIEAVRSGGNFEDIFAAISKTYDQLGDKEGWREHHLGGSSGFQGRDTKVAPNIAKTAIPPGQPFVFNPVYGMGKSEDTFIIAPKTGKLECITIDRMWPTNSVGGYCRPGVLIMDVGNRLEQEVGLFGLGRMGLPIANRLARMGCQIFAYDKAYRKKDLQYPTFMVQHSPRNLCLEMSNPRRIILLVPDDEVDNVLFGEQGLEAICDAGDIIMDCGNSNHRDSIRRGDELAKKGIGYMDSGSSGGIAGAETGLCIACGGSKSDFKSMEPIVQALAGKSTYMHVGELGAGHFLKMIHNGIEYGILQAVAEGCAIADADYYGYGTSAATLTQAWRRGSIVESKIFDWFYEVTRDDAYKELTPEVGGGRTGRWAYEDATISGIDAPVLKASLDARANPSDKLAISAQLLASVRLLFGGHAVKKIGN